MTSEGSPLSILRRAIKGGNPATIDPLAIEVGHVPLEDALEITVVYFAAGDERAYRAARRLANRIVVERALRGDPADRVHELAMGLPESADDLRKFVG